MFARLFRARRNQGRRAAAPSRRVRLGVEGLEDRCVPSAVSPLASAGGLSVAPGALTGPQMIGTAPAAKVGLALRGVAAQVIRLAHEGQALPLPAVQNAMGSLAGDQFLHVEVQKGGPGAAATVLANLAGGTRQTGGPTAKDQALIGTAFQEAHALSLPRFQAAIDRAAAALASGAGAAQAGAAPSAPNGAAAAASGSTAGGGSTGGNTGGGTSGSGSTGGGSSGATPGGSGAGSANAADGQPASGGASGDGTTVVVSTTDTTDSAGGQHISQTETYTSPDGTVETVQTTHDDDGHGNVQETQTVQVTNPDGSVQGESATVTSDAGGNTTTTETDWQSSSNDESSGAGFVLEPGAIDPNLPNSVPAAQGAPSLTNNPASNPLTINPNPEGTVGGGAVSPLPLGHAPGAELPAQEQATDPASSLFLVKAVPFTGQQTAGVDPRVVNPNPAAPQGGDTSVGTLPHGPTGVASAVTGLGAAPAAQTAPLLTGHAPGAATRLV
jgi:hypothetical protein